MENLSLEVQPGLSLPFSIFLASSVLPCPLHQHSLDTDVSQTRETEWQKENPFFLRMSFNKFPADWRSPSVSKEEEEGWEWELGIAEGSRTAFSAAPSC